MDEVLAAEETEYMCISIAGVVHMQESIFTQEAAKADDALCKRDNSSAQEGFDWVDFRRCLRRTNGSDTEDVVSKDIASVWPWQRPILICHVDGGLNLEGKQRGHEQGREEVRFSRCEWTASRLHVD